MKRRLAVAAFGVACLLPLVLARIIQHVATEVPFLVFKAQWITGIEISPDGKFLLARLDFTPPLTCPGGAAYCMGSFVHWMAPGYAMWNLNEGRIAKIWHVEEYDPPMGRGVTYPIRFRAESELTNPKTQTVQVRLNYATSLYDPLRRLSQHTASGAEIAAASIVPDILTANSKSDSNNFCLGEGCSMQDTVGQSSDGKRIRVLTGHILSEFDLPSRRFLRDIRLCEPASGQDERGFFAPDGRIFFNRGSNALEIDFDDKNMPHQLALNKINFSRDLTLPPVFSPDAKLVCPAPNSSGQPSGIFDSETWQRLWTTGDEEFCQFSADGKEAYCYSSDGTVSIRNSRSGAPIGKLKNIQSDKIAVSPDRRWLYEAREDRVLRWALPRLN